MNETIDDSRWLNRLQATRFLKVSPMVFGDLIKEGRVIGHSLTSNGRKRYDREELKKLYEPDKAVAK